MSGQRREPRHLGTRRELFVDHHLIDELHGSALALGRPRDEGVVFAYDRPWEGRYSGYGTVLRVGPDDYRYYYSGCPAYTSDTDMARWACVATSTDGMRWERPDLGHFEVHGTRANNVILDEPSFALNFAPFIDPAAAPGTGRFKAVAGTRFTGLVLFDSDDGIRWRKMFRGRPVLRGDYLDSKNVVFWSPSEQCYVMIARLWRDGWTGHRWIGRATSADLRHWGPLAPVRIRHGGADVPLEHYYHNGTAPYFRAPHIHIALCSQLTERCALTGDEVAALDLEDPGRARALGGGGLLSSRGGNTFERTFMEEFVRPPMGPEHWVARCNTPAVGVVQTGAAEMSFYVDIRSGQPARALCRHSLRLDGFASLRAPFDGGQMLTRPFTFEGDGLSINYATASRGHLRFQFETPARAPIDGYTLAECPPVIGNELARCVRFDGSTSVARLAGRPVRLRVVMCDADLYALRFEETGVESGD